MALSCVSPLAPHTRRPSYLAGVSLQSVLRFLILCSRNESRKCQGRAGSITAGYNIVEDAESMRRFLCDFTCDVGAGKQKKPPPGAQGQGSSKVAGKRAAPTQGARSTRSSDEQERQPLGAGTKKAKPQKR